MLKLLREICFIDVHCHIEDELFNEDRDSVLKRAKDSNVCAVISSALSFDDASFLLNFSNKYPRFVFVSLGWDPADLSIIKLFDEYCNFVKEHKNEIVGLGEVGLDFYYIRENVLRETQIKLFRRWIQFSKDLNLPLIVHSRSAGKYAVKILMEEDAERVVLHAYDGRPGWALKGVEHGYFFSIPTSVWHSIQKQKLVRLIPLDNMLLETDSPVLSPFKGRRNEPANIIYAARKIAEIKKITVEKVAEITTENALSLFNLSL